MYATKVVEDGELVSASHGTFSADAELIAHLGILVPRLGGTITNFRGDEDMSDWSMELSPANLLNASGNNDVPASTNGGVDDGGATSATMGDASGEGVWTAGLFGPSTDNASPSGIAGTFNADFTAAHIAGVYGVTRVAE